MPDFWPKMISEILNHAKQEYPRESCGLVVIYKGREKYVPCRNIATERHAEFLIDPSDYAKAEDLGEVVKVVHSHPKSAPNPSQNDKVAIEQSKLPWIICNPLTDQWTETCPSGYTAPLIGREYGYGILDCYTLIKDYFSSELNITLKDYQRLGTIESDAEGYLNNWEDYGFAKVNSPEKHDVILMCLGHNKPNHAAIYLGNNIMLHHCRNRLSSRDVYGGYWQKNCYGYFRHLDLIAKV